MGYKLKMNSIRTILKAHNMERDGNLEKFLRDEIDRLSDPYVPMRTGDLKNNKTYPNNHSIKYTSPYAHYMYKGKLMLASNGSSWAKKGEKKHYTNIPLKYQGAPKRGAEWDKRMVRDKKSQIERDLKNYMK